MKTKMHLILLLLMCTTVHALAQSFTLQGRVTDQEMKPVEFATVSCLQQAKVAFTDLKGQFKMTLQSADSVVIKFSMIGYKSKVRVLRNRAESKPSKYNCSTRARSWAKWW